jgi:hypothetical protein
MEPRKARGGNFRGLVYNPSEDASGREEGNTHRTDRLAKQRPVLPWCTRLPVIPPVPGAFFMVHLMVGIALGLAGGGEESQFSCQAASRDSTRQGRVTLTGGSPSH